MEVVGIAPVRARMPLPAARSAPDVEHHYRVEIELAGRLRNAPRDERLGLYGRLYDELYQRVPDHPQLTRKVSAAERSDAIADRVTFLQRFIDPQTVFLEVGAGDCSLTVAMAERIRKAYALDVSREIISGAQHPRLEPVLSDGCSVPVPPGSVTLAYSNQVMEHIHPDDALEQLRNLFAAIAPGGSYLCITPNRLNGPHDVSKYFDNVARGFHLKEYTNTELEQLFRGVGFRQVHAYPRFGRRFVRVPLGVVKTVEAVLEVLPAAWRRSVGRLPIIRNLLTPALRAIR